MGVTFKKTNYRNCPHYGQPRARIKVGTYTGDGTDDRTIDIGVNLAAASNVYIIIKHITTQQAVHRIEYGQGDATMFYPSGADQNNAIQQLMATGFQIGSSNYVNQNTYVYRYIVFYEE